MARFFFNLITILFVLLTIGEIVVFGSVLTAPPPAREVAALPTVVVLPSLTPSNTPTRTPVPSWTFTPSTTPTRTPTFTPSRTLSVTPSRTLSPTPVPPSATVPTATITETAFPSETPLPTATATFTPSLTLTPSPTGPTVSPFLFGLREGQPIYTQNFANTAGCSWEGIGGQVFGLNNQAAAGFQVHVFGPSLDRYVLSDSNTLYGPGGWEQPVSNAVSGNTYYVELLSPGGTVVSPRITVTFTADCARNLALVNFEQKRSG